MSITTGLKICCMTIFFACSAISPAAELGLPAITYPANNPPTSAKIALGKQLFHDERLSANGTISCATCHIADQAFSDGLSVAKGLGGQLGTRNTPTLLNVAFENNFFWDSRRATLGDQVRDPFILNPAIK